MKRTKLIPLVGLGLTLFLSKPHLIYGNTTFGGGSGTKVDPYLISTPEHLTQLQVAVDGGNSFSGKHFILTNDIDFTGYDNDSNPDNGNFEPIGHYDSKGNILSFSGDLDGQGYIISNVSIKKKGSEASLFASIDNANISDIHLRQINTEGFLASGLSINSKNSAISQITIEGNIRGTAVGGIVTEVEHSTIQESSFEGTINGGNSSAGGVASIATNSTISQITVEGEVAGMMYIGGIIGAAKSTIIQDCRVEGEIQGERFTGGVIGTLEGGDISDTKFEGSVTGDAITGGLVGMTNGGGIIQNNHVKGEITGNDIVGGIIGGIEPYGVGLFETSFQGNVSGQVSIGGLIGFNLSAMPTTIQKCFVNGNIEGTIYIGGLIGYQIGILQLSNSYALGTVTGETTVGGSVGYIHDIPEEFSSASNSLIQNSYHQTVVTGTSDVGQLIGQLGGGEEFLGTNTKGDTAFENVYLSEEVNQGTPTVGNIFMGEVLNEDVSFLSTDQMTKHKAKENMSNLDFENIWVMTSTTPMFRWQKDLISATDGDIQINGKIETMVADVTIPSVSPDLVINPNLPEGFVAPEFSVSNDSVSPIKLELKTFEQTTNTFNDVLPTKYDSWIGLNKQQSRDIALGLIAKEGEGWQSLTTPISYVANHTDHEIGIIKPTSTVDFSFDVKHGTAFSEAKTVQYKMVFVFDLMN